MRFMSKIIGIIKISITAIVKPAKFIMGKFVGITKKAVKSNKNTSHPLQTDREI